MSRYFLSFLEGKALEKWENVSSECQRRLAGQKIVPGDPGTILSDVDALIEFIGPAGTASKSGNATLAPELLPELNRKVSHPVELGLKRALLRDYPNLAGLFILLRVMDLLRVEGKRLVVCPAALAFWRSLNHTEQYFALVEALLFQAHSSVLGALQSREDDQAFEMVTAFLGQLSGKWRTFSDHDVHCLFRPQGFLPPWNLFVQQQMGLIELRSHNPSKEDRRHGTGRGWLAGGARLTPWGEAVTWALIESSKEDRLAAEDREDESWVEVDLSPGEENPDIDPASPEPDPASVFGVLQSAFQPYVSEWRTIYARPDREERPGTHIFKVTLGGWRVGNRGAWRRLAVPSELSLDSLADAILDAFQFDNDHLYDFRFRDESGKGRIYHHPEMDEGPWTTEITVGETGLPVKAEMVFTFDYGDRWEFKVRLERIDYGPDRCLAPQVIESAGEAPEQYPRCEE